MKEINDNHIIRRNLAYFWSLVGALFLAYACKYWAAGHPEIQTLLMGFVLGGGVVGAVMGAYFNNLPGKPGNASTGPAINQADNVTVNNPGSDTPAVTDTPTQ